MTKKEIRDLGFERGFNIASWIDLPEIGAQIWTESDGRVTVDESNQWDVVQSLAYEAESNDRQFSPFEFTASELNALEEHKPYDVWEVFEAGISAGISAQIRKRRRAL